MDNDWERGTSGPDDVPILPMTANVSNCICIREACGMSRKVSGDVTLGVGANPRWWVKKWVSAGASS